MKKRASCVVRATTGARGSPLHYPLSPFRDPRYSHSIITESSKLFICMAVAAASQISTVIFAANLSRISIGAGLRAIRQQVTFRDLSGSIGSHDGCRHHGRASVSVGEAPKKGRHRTR